jgi:WD40 repeat protein
MNHKGPVTSVAFSPDGRLVLTGSADKTAQLWDAVHSRSAGSPWQHEGAVTGVAFDKQGRVMLTGSASGGGRLMLVPPAAAESDERTRLRVELTTGTELDSDGMVQPLSEKDWLDRRKRLINPADNTSRK